MCGGETPITEFPLGIGYLLSNIAGHELTVTKDPKLLLHQEIVGLSANAWGLKEAVDIAKKLNDESPETQIILGGQGALWRNLDRPQDYGFTYVVRGDGEWCLQDILDGRICPYTVMRRRIEDINALHFPVRGKCGKSVPIVTSRGCPYHCRFCSSRAQWGTPRLRSVSNIACEIERLLTGYPKMNELYIFDDLWAYPPGRFDSFYSWWMKAKMNRRLGLRGFVRSNMVTKDLLKKMKAMGFNRVRFGAETASPRLLKEIGKGETVEDHQRAVDLANQVGLPITASFMSGLPTETKKDVALTQAFLAKNKGKLQVEGRYKFKPFPGCELYRGENPLQYDMRVRPS
jgi:radical SAM superfamily enzyme YgiQ (UPF0313 family)